jgi:hypothetical protein
MARCGPPLLGLLLLGLLLRHGAERVFADVEFDERGQHLVRHGAPIEAACSVSDCSLDEIATPDWETSRFRWPYYVPDSIADVWDDLPLEAKLIAFIHAANDSCGDDPDRFDY